MGWLLELGGQIRKARKSAGMSQEELSAKVSARFTITRAQISNIENGNCAPAVNIVTEIAEALDAEFVIEGCKIGKRADLASSPLGAVPQQLSLEFDVDHTFTVTALKLTSMPEDAISLQAVITRKIA